MVKRIVFGEQEEFLEEAVGVFLGGKKAVALSGAGISVESGIPDFRSPGGLWTVFRPEEYATIDAFLETPQKAWKLYREIGRTLRGKEPNPAHKALARLELREKLEGVITQNIDNLHQKAGSLRVVEVHGEHQHLQCLNCGKLVRVELEFFEEEEALPRCETCSAFLKPNVVLFGEPIRGTEEITELLYGCDRLLVVGTSAQVDPVARIPGDVEASGGIIFEFNQEETALTRGERRGLSPFSLFRPDFGEKGEREIFFFKGKAGTTLARFADRVLAQGSCT